jgi:hypothetical protein
VFVLRCGVSGELVSPWFWTREDAELARGHSELLEIEPDNTVPIPRGLDRSISARARRRGRAFDPFGMFWDDFRRRTERSRDDLQGP